MFVTHSYTAYSENEVTQKEKDLKKDGFTFLEEKGYYRYYKNYVGITACIYIEYKT